jgi:hypothetical protein
MDRNSGLIQFEPATSLEDVYKTMSTGPLLTPREIQAFYRGGINKVRGGDKVGNLARGLERSWHASFFKAFLAGHPGVGKSTEMTRLVEMVNHRFRAIRFQVTEDLDPGSFKPFDVLLLMMTRIVEETAKPVSEGGAGQNPAESLLQEIYDWFAQEEKTHTTSEKAGVEVSAGMGPPASSLWQKVSGLFANIKGEIKYASDRSTKVVEYRLQRVSSLLALVNKLVSQCNDLLRGATGHEWMFIGEDFDKPGIPIRLVEDFFLNYANIFKGLQGHAIFTIPIGLVYSERGTQLPCSPERIHVVPDTPVFDRDHTECRQGRSALLQILVARVSPKLFGSNQMKRLIIASGGNLRDLFGMVRQAADWALDRGANGKIGKADADRAIAFLRTDYTRKLGVGPYDAAELTYAQKAERLVAVYGQDRDYDVPDPILYSLLNARAVLEFDGERWFGVHPLVVDILKRQGRLVSAEGGKVRGGTE